MAQKLKGTIVSNKMAKTVIVEVNRLTKHPRYGKFMNTSKRYQAHTDEQIPLGSLAVIESTRPISRHKRWRVISFVVSQNEKTTAEAAGDTPDTISDLETIL